MITDEFINGIIKDIAPIIDALPEEIKTEREKHPPRKYPVDNLFNAVISLVTINEELEAMKK